MNYHDVMIKHLTLQKNVRSGKLSPEEYRQKTNDLQMRAADGVLWRIKPDGSGWESNDGTGWAESAPLFEQDGSTRDVDGIYRLPEYPATVFQFLKQFATKSVEAVKKHWIAVVVIFAAVLLFTLYLNFGYRFGASKLYNFFAAIFGNSSQILAKLLLAFVLAFMAVKLIISIKTKKLQASIKKLSAIPKLISRAIARDMKIAFSVLLVSTAIGMLLAVLFSNIFLALLLSMSYIMVVADWNKSSLFLLAALVESDCKKIFKKDPTIYTDFFIMLFAGLAAGSLLAVYFINALPIITYIAFGLLIAAAIFLAIFQKKAVR